MPEDDASSSGSKTPMPLRDDPNRHYFQNISPSAKSSGLAIPNSPPSRGDSLRERRSSISSGLDTIRHAGGVNSIDAFARSWTRAAGYFEITPARQSYVSVSSRDEEDGEENALLDDEDDDRTPMPHGSFRAGSFSSTTYGSVARGSIPTERLNESVARHAADLFAEQQAAAVQPVDKEREPLLVKTVEHDGVVEQIIVGQSTLPQTVFNSVNVLVGIGLLSLPLGLKYSGWILGMGFLLFSAVVTNYTAKLLARCLMKAPSQAFVSYSDIAYIAYGARARIFVSILFTFELLGACTAMVVLFADSLHLLLPNFITATEWKIVSFFLLTPLSFLPLRVLSFSSVIGILSTLGIFLVVFANGLIKPDAPGSLRDPMATYLMPQSWLALPLSFGLLMSPWGGHGVFPNIFRDMRHPAKYPKAVDITYLFTFVLDAAMAVIGLLMFGDGVLDEITLNVLGTSGYPEVLKVTMVVLISIIPLTKTPLNARPIISTLEVVMGVDARAIANPESIVGMSGMGRGVLKIVIRVVTNIVFVGIAIVVPGFDRIISFVGSALCFTVCIILPLLFYLKIFGDEVSRREKILDWFLIIISSIMAILGTIFTFIPNDKLGVTTN